MDNRSSTTSSDSKLISVFFFFLPRYFAIWVNGLLLILIWVRVGLKIIMMLVVTTIYNVVIAIVFVCPAIVLFIY